MIDLEDTDRFQKLYRMPYHLWVLSKEFDDVRGKTLDQVFAEIREESKRLSMTEPKPTCSPREEEECGEGLDSADQEAESMEMSKASKDFLNIFKMPYHLWLEAEEFDEVRGKTREQVLAEIKEKAKRLSISPPEPERSLGEGKAEGPEAKAA